MDPHDVTVSDVENCVKVDSPDDGAVFFVHLGALAAAESTKTAAQGDAAAAGGAGVPASDGVSGGSTGPRRTFVVKASNNTAAECFGCAAMSVFAMPTPTARVVSASRASNPIWLGIKAAAETKGDVGVLAKARSVLDRPHFLLLTCVPEARSLRSLGPAALPMLDPSTPAGACRWWTLGRMSALDVWLNNWDRLPHVWDNEGNGGNVLLCPVDDAVTAELRSCWAPGDASAANPVAAAAAAASYGVGVAVIDTTPACMNLDLDAAAPRAHAYFARSRTWLAAVLHDATAASGEDIDPLGRHWSGMSKYFFHETGKRPNVASLLAFARGVRQGVADVLGASADIVETLLKATADATAGYDWHGVWAASLGGVHAKFLRETTRLFREVADELGGLPPPLSGRLPKMHTPVAAGDRGAAGTGGAGGVHSGNLVGGAEGEQPRVVPQRRRGHSSDLLASMKRVQLKKTTTIVRHPDGRTVEERVGEHSAVQPISTPASPPRPPRKLLAAKALRNVSLKPTTTRVAESGGNTCEAARAATPPGRPRLSAASLQGVSLRQSQVRVRAKDGSTHLETRDGEKVARTGTPARRAALRSRLSFLTDDALKGVALKQAKKTAPKGQEVSGGAGSASRAGAEQSVSVVAAGVQAVLPLREGCAPNALVRVAVVQCHGVSREERGGLEAFVEYVLDDLASSSDGVFPSLVVFPEQ